MYPSKKNCALTMRHLNVINMNNEAQRVEAVAQRCSVNEVFSCEFYETSKNTFSYEHFWWLLLKEPAATPWYNLSTDRF